MIELNFSNIKNLPFEIIKGGDLLYFEGPILSHFVGNDGGDYLMYWVDSDSKHNRWLLFSYNLIDIYDYLNNNISLKELINRDRDLVYLIDFDNEIKMKKVFVGTNKQIPIEYLPEKDSYLDDNIKTEYLLKLSNNINEVFSKYKLSSKTKTWLRDLDSSRFDFNTIKSLNNKKIRNTIDEIIFLKVTEAPVQILLDHHSSDLGLNRAYFIHKHAYTNPLEMDGYIRLLYKFIENRHLKKERLNAQTVFRVVDIDDINMDNLFTDITDYTSTVVSANPDKYSKYFNGWKKEIKESHENIYDLLED